MWADEVEHPAIPFDPPKFDDDGEPVYNFRKGWVERGWRARLKDEFFMTVVDQAHAIKNQPARNWATVSSPIR